MFSLHGGDQHMNMLDVKEESIDVEGQLADACDVCLGHWFGVTLLSVEINGKKRVILFMG